MKASKISGPTSNNKVSKKYLSIAGIDEVCHTSHKECEHHVYPPQMETFVAENAKDEDGDNLRIGSRTTQTIATHDASCALHIDDG